MLFTMLLTVIPELNRMENKMIPQISIIISVGSIILSLFYCLVKLLII